MRPSIKASYSASLFVVGKENHGEALTTIPSSLSRMRPDLLPFELEDPSLKTVHLVHGSHLAGVNLAWKPAKI